MKPHHEAYEDEESFAKFIHLAVNGQGKPPHGLSSIIRVVLARCIGLGPIRYVTVSGL